jgi:large repetitive protein
VGAPVATTAAKIAGTAKVGQTLSITDPVWDTDGVANPYAWMRNGVAIAGATAKTYKVTAQDAGKQIVASVAPSITGGNKVGGLLQINPGTWLNGLVTPGFSYQWYNIAGSIPGATSRNCVPTLADAGKPLAATVTATLTGFLDGLDVTNVVKVAKVASKTVLKRVKGPLVSVRLSPSGAHPTGKVRLVKGTKTLKTVKVRAADNGKRTVRLPKLRKGTHRIRAVYAGDAMLKGSRSKVLRVVIR